MFPELPTETNNPEVVSSLLDPQLTLQVLIVRLKQEIRKTNKNFFIFYSIPKVKYYWIRRTQYIPEFGWFYKKRGFYLEGVRLWRISGGYLQGMMGLVLGGYSFTFSPFTLIMSPSNVSNLGKWSLISNQGILSLKGGSILKPGIFGNCVFATFSKNIKHLTFAGCQSEIPPNSSRFRMNRKYCYQSATKF